MSVLYIVLPLSLLLGALFLGAFIWSVRRGQLDDLETPALRMLADDEQAPKDPSSDGATDGRRQ